MAPDCRHRPQVLLLLCFGQFFPWALRNPLAGRPFPDSVPAGQRTVLDPRCEGCFSAGAAHDVVRAESPLEVPSTGLAAVHFSPLSQGLRRWLFPGNKALLSLPGARFLALASPCGGE